MDSEDSHVHYDVDQWPNNESCSHESRPAPQETPNNDDVNNDDNNDVNNYDANNDLWNCVIGSNVFINLKYDKKRTLLSIIIIISDLIDSIHSRDLHAIY